MKIPRSISGVTLVKKLEKLGYTITRQSGSHIRLTTQLSGEHHITIPRHDPLKVEPLSSIINAVAEHFLTTKEGLVKDLF
ncbi:MAG: type II toxin-antitoxin system HicA family toxin [Bacteroidota bacterium]